MEKFCPLTQRICLEDKCMLYFSYEHKPEDMGEYDCAFTAIAQGLEHIQNL